ncbi:MAG: Lon protease family protein [Gammaproteobacteria bacterium]
MTTPLTPAQLRRRTDPAVFPFADTSALEPLATPLGQDRAFEALGMGVRMAGSGYNVFACGPNGTGRRSLVLAELAREAAQRPVPDDWCYVHNFRQDGKPVALRLPAGQGARLAGDMRKLIEDMQTALPAAFGREENRHRQEEIEEEVQERQHEALNALNQRANADGVLLLETPAGFAFAPRGTNGEAMNPGVFQQLPPEEQARLKQKIEALQEELQHVLRQFPIWVKEARERLRALTREIAEYVVHQLVEDLLGRYRDLPEVVAYLRIVGDDITEHALAFMPAPPQPGPLQEAFDRTEFFKRYAVNLLVDHRDARGAPVEMLDLPSLGNLLGRIEHRALMGTFMTDFTLVKAGALHRANGGFLVIDARQLLMQPFAWEALKRTLHAREIRLDASDLQFSLLTTVSVEPTPIPLDVKVVLVGDRWLLYALEGGDPEFRDLFKIIADFEDQMPRTAEIELLYARRFADLAREACARPLTREAVATLIEQCARLTDDALRLTTHVHSIDELIREADYWAASVGHASIESADITRAIEKQFARVDRVRQRLQESILRGVKVIATDGAAVGQINGLSVLNTDSISFGLPSRITATTRIGDGRVLDIEREIELGGPLHSKGVLILSHFLATRFAATVPLSMAASITFEQSYGFVDGDSASLAELCALLSSLAETPILQRYAVTGSVNQLGEVQAIGGVNEKIEGFFDICRARGLAPGQGVLIPATNTEHLMLREDVVAAAAAGTFAIHAVTTVDEALALLTGVPAGTRGEDGAFPPDTLNHAVDRKLQRYARLRRSFGAAADGRRRGRRDDE